MRDGGLTRPVLDRIRRSVPLAPLTTWNIGGPAEFFVEPRSVEEMEELSQYARSVGLPLTVIGRGSNILVDAAGIAGLVICTRMLLGLPVLGPEDVRVAAGYPMPRLAITASKAGRDGLDFMIGIPGTVGAGIAVNAGLGGIGGVEMGSVLLSASVLDVTTGTVRIEAAEKLGLRYRHSDIPSRGLVVLEATLRAKPAVDPLLTYVRQREILDSRRAKQPLQRHTSGSVFKQPLGGRPAGWYIDQAGLKGFGIGGARISAVHANWIENEGAATAQDVRDLIEHVISSVEAKFGIVLEREVVYLG